MASPGGGGDPSRPHSGRARPTLRSPQPTANTVTRARVYDVYIRTRCDIHTYIETPQCETARVVRHIADTGSSKGVTNDLLLPAINGTTEILKAIKMHAPTVNRVVVTSSFVSIVDSSKGNRPGYAYSEKDWNPNPFAGYYGSKTLAEKAAWEFIETEKPNFDLVTICPPLVYGPVLQEVTSMKALNTSSAQFYSIFNGEDKQLNNVRVWLWVDVRDVAKAHVAALEKRTKAGGQRFLVSEGTFNLGQVTDYIWKHYPDRALEKGVPKDTSSVGYPPDRTYISDNSASRSVLGIEYLLFESMLKDQLAQFVALEEGLEGKRGEKL
ncbi:methylglyoxal reductase (NADPH-dependent) gre2 [Ceratobasidium sp. 394]|nr:methylglyoxal reductase (NADPH-dependent) gre2 [Ceratobasidium sp. 394]